MPVELVLWNTALCIFAIVNVALWLSAKMRLQRRAAALPAEVLAARRTMLGLSAAPVIAAWREDMPWLTLYFSAGVWLSIALVDVPPLGARHAGRAWGARAQALSSNSDRIAYGSARASRHGALSRS
jgi:hypothetical protein